MVAPTCAAGLVAARPPELEPVRVTPSAGPHDSRGPVRQPEHDGDVKHGTDGADGFDCLGFGRRNVIPVRRPTSVPTG